MSKKKPTAARTTKTKVGGFKIVRPPKDAARRRLLSGSDITASGGCRTVQRQSAH